MNDFLWAAVFLTGASMAGAMAWLTLWAIGAERRIKALENEGEPPPADEAIDG